MPRTKKNHIAQNEDPRFHNTYQFLKHYRDATCQIAPFAKSSLLSYWIFVQVPLPRRGLKAVIERGVWYLWGKDTLSAPAITLARKVTP